MRYEVFCLMGGRGGAGGVAPTTRQYTMTSILEDSIKHLAFSEKQKQYVRDAVQDVIDEFGTEVFNSFERVENISSQDVYGNAGVFDKTVGLNDKLFEMDNFYENDIRTGFQPYAPKDKYAASTIYHELGHMLNFAIMRKSAHSSDFLDVARAYHDKKNTVNIVNEAYKSIKGQFSSVKEARASISRYSLENTKETIAEAVSDYMVNGDNAKAMSKAIVNEIKWKLK